MKRHVILLQVRIRFQFRLQRILLQTLTFIFTAKWRPWKNSNVDLLKRTEFFSRTRVIDFLKITDEWSKTYHMMELGNFHKANKLRREILEEIYNFHEVNYDYYPPLLCHDFLGPIGHKAFTGIHIMAQEIGMIPKGLRIGIINPDDIENNLLSLYKNNLKLTPYREGKGFTDYPVNWHLVERTEMIRGFGKFIEPYSLVDEVFRTRESTPYNSFFELTQNQELYAHQALAGFGFNKSDWFVGLHIRDGSATPSLRNQKVTNYIPAIKEITKKGGWVIRIGGTEMPPLPKLPQVIDLVTEPNAGRDLHLFVLSRAKFFIGTCSGPQYFPPQFGVPTLFTNQIGIGRSVLTWSKHSIHLPKIYLKNDKSKPSLAEMLYSPFGFGELSLKEYTKLGINVQENSPEEIRDAVIEMFNRISGEIPSNEDEFDARVSDIRSQFEWASKGRFSNSFLQSNENWFLS